jgi:hypothetical protein
VRSRKAVSGPKRGNARGTRRIDRLGQRIGADAISPASCLAVYSGQTCVGFLMPRGREGAEAFDADTRSLGVFPDPQSAAAAIRAKARDE